jgi:hypothetical protein
VCAGTTTRPHVGSEEEEEAACHEITSKEGLAHTEGKSRKQRRAPPKCPSQRGGLHS